MRLAKQTARIGTQFEIDGALLAEDTAGWRNLGLWNSEDDRKGRDFSGNHNIEINPPTPFSVSACSYVQAAEALARKVGEAAHLSEETTLLDLACGQGASLWLWQRMFYVTKLSALEIQSACIDYLRHQAQLDWNVVQGRFDALPIPEAILPASYDAVVSVDAAYHARSLSAFLQVARAALAEGGRLAFTTLAINPTHGALTLPESLLLGKAEIPTASLQTPNDIKSSMGAAGFNNVSIERLDDQVFAGFAHHVRQRSRHLSWKQRLSFSWLKIRSTGVLCEWLANTQRLHYVLVSGDAKKVMSIC